jgi:hypothetical protein
MLMDIEQNNISSASSLSTKQRLFQNVIGGSNSNPTTKKIVTPPRPVKRVPLVGFGSKKIVAPLPLPHDTASESLSCEEDDFFPGIPTDDTPLLDVRQPSEPDSHTVEDRSVPLYLKNTYF